MNSVVKGPASADLKIQIEKPSFGQPLEQPFQLSQWLGKAIARINRWSQRSRQRRRLLALPPEMLKDIGISRADAVREGSKPFWRV